MVNIGEFSEIVNSNNLTLEVGTDNYITLKNLQLHIGRPESRKATTGGIVYTYGKGDHWYTATLVATTPELEDSTPNFVFLTELDSNGDLPSRAWKIVAKNISGATKTFAATGLMNELDLRKGEEPDSVEIDIRVRITGDTIAVT